jgi:autotransporter translocation and assembly factor TamB
MHRALRYFRRVVAILVLVIAFLVFALMIVSRTAAFNRFLRDKVVAFANSTYRGQLSIGRIEGSIWSGLRLEQVTLRYEGKPIASISQLSLDYSLVPLLWRTLHTRMLIESPQIGAARDVNGKWNLLEALSSRVPAPPPKTAATRSLTIEVDGLQVRNGNLAVEPQPNGPIYRVADLSVDSQASLPSSGMRFKLQRLTANLIAPKMPPFYAATSLDYDALVSPAAVHLTDLELRTQHSTISVAGEARLAQTPSVDLKLSLPRMAATDVAQLSPSSPLKSDLSGTITLTGPENALHSVIVLQTAGATLNGTADADAIQKHFAASVKIVGADLQRIVRVSGAAGVLDATLDARGAAADLLNTSANVHLHGRNVRVRQYDLGTLDMTATAANKNAHLLMTVAAPGGYLTADGTSSIASNPAYHLNVASRHLNIANAAERKSAPTDLNLVAVIDGHGLSPAAVNTALTVKAARSQVGQVTLDKGLVEARLANNRVEIGRMHFEAVQSTIDVHGNAGLAADSPAGLFYAVHSSNIKELLAIARTNGGGRIDITGRLAGTRSALRTNGDMSFQALHASGYSVTHGTTSYDVAITGPGAPFGRLNAAISGVKGRAELHSLTLSLDALPGLPHAVSLRLSAKDNAGRNDLLATHFAWRPGSITGQLTQISLDLPGGKWQLVTPADYAQNARGVSLSRLQLQSGVRELLLDGTIAREGAQNFRAMLSRFDLAAVQPLIPRLHNLRGVLSTELRVGGTAAVPTIDFGAKASALRMDKQPIGDLDATVKYAGERAALSALLRQNATDHLNAAGSLPMNLSWANGVKAKIGNTIDLTVNSAHLNLAQLGSLFPDDVRNFRGAASIDLRVQGPLKQPVPAGSLRITGLQGEVVPLGVNLSEAHTSLTFDAREVRIETLEAHASGGSFLGNGALGLAPSSPHALGISLRFDNWPAINTQQYAARIGGNLAAGGTLSEPRLHGRLEVLNALIQPDLAFLSTTSNLAPDDTIMVVQPGQKVPVPEANAIGPNVGPSPPPVAKPPPSMFNNLAMQIAVVIHRNTWIRHPDAAIELEGNLDVEKAAGGTVRVIGDVHTVRGWMNYYNRQFTVKTGALSFTGGSKIDPGLDIDAQYVVTNYTVDILVGGTASKPTLQFRSQPDLAQADILSLILFGKTTDALGRGQQASLQQQAAKMATGVAARQVGQAVASSLGLQSIGIQLNDSSSSGPSVGLGHYVGENTYVSASQPVGGGTGRKLSVQYFLTRWLSITSTSSSDGSREIDLGLVKNY